MRIYLAAPWKHRIAAQSVALELERAGHRVISRWLWFHGKDEKDHTILAEEAAHDWADLASCEVLVLLNIELSEGKAVEQGMALQMGKPIIAVGGVRTNIFQYLQHYTWLPDVAAVLDVLASGLRSSPPLPARP